MSPDYPSGDDSDPSASETAATQRLDEDELRLIRTYVSGWKVIDEYTRRSLEAAAVPPELPLTTRALNCIERLFAEHALYRSMTDQLCPSVSLENASIFPKSWRSRAPMTDPTDVLLLKIGTGTELHVSRYYDNTSGLCRVRLVVSPSGETATGYTFSEAQASILSQLERKEISQDADPKPA